MFNTFMWWLNVLWLSWLAALIRRAIHWRRKDQCVERYYDHPSDVGYSGWIEDPKLGPLAFKNLDGNLVYRW